MLKRRGDGCIADDLSLLRGCEEKVGADIKLGLAGLATSGRVGDAGFSNNTDGLVSSDDGILIAAGGKGEVVVPVVGAAGKAEEPG